MIYITKIIIIAVLLAYTSNGICQRNGDFNYIKQKRIRKVQFTDTITTGIYNNKQITYTYAHNGALFEIREDYTVNLLAPRAGAKSLYEECANKRPYYIKKDTFRETKIEQFDTLIGTDILYRENYTLLLNNLLVPDSTDEPGYNLSLEIIDNKDTIERMISPYYYKFSLDSFDEVRDDALFRKRTQNNIVIHSVYHINCLSGEKSEGDGRTRYSIVRSKILVDTGLIIIKADLTPNCKNEPKWGEYCCRSIESVFYDKENKPSLIRRRSYCTADTFALDEITSFINEKEIIKVAMYIDSSTFFSAFTYYPKGAVHTAKYWNYLRKPRFDSKYTTSVKEGVIMTFNEKGKKVKVETYRATKYNDGSMPIEELTIVFQADKNGNFESGYDLKYFQKKYSEPNLNWRIKIIKYVK